MNCDSEPSQETISFAYGFLGVAVFYSDPKLRVANQLIEPIDKFVSGIKSPRPR
jgi:hypothetical protein